jgi:hypothetical protein
MSTKNTRLKKAISLVDYCHNKMARRFFPTYIISNGVGRLFLNGEEITEKELNDLYPVPDRIYYRENSNTKDDWKNKPQ